MALRIIEYLDQRGRSPFAPWFEGLNAEAAAKVTVALYQVGAGNRGNTKGVGGDSLVILLGGSTKQRQQQAIEAARERWMDYRRRKVLRKG